MRQADRAVDIHYNSGDGTAFSRTRNDYGSVAAVRGADLNADGAPDLLLSVDGDDLTVSAVQHGKLAAIDIDRRLREG